MTVGIDPAVAIYNGFSTLGGYFTSYSLQYKHEFRKIMSSELNKYDKLRKYFDNWGSRCQFIICGDIYRPWEHGKGGDAVFKDIDINIEQFKKMGGEYIFAGGEIANFNDNGLEFLRRFGSNNTGRVVYLYQAI